MFLNLLGALGLLSSIIYMLISTLKTPVLSYADINIAIQQTTPRINSPSPSPKTQETISYSGYCLNVPILMYHHIQPQNIAKEKWQTNFTVDNGTFDSQMAYLLNFGYTTISLEQLSQALTNHQKLSQKSIVLTFDDGYEDIYTYAFPIIQKYQLKTNLMIATGLIGNPDYLHWQQLKEMTASGQVFVYNHTWSHNNLTSSTGEKIKYEIQTANSQLENYLGVKTNIFAYPYGSQNSNVINILKENSFIAAVSTLPGQTQCDSFIMSLHRTRIGNSQLKSYGI